MKLLTVLSIPCYVLSGALLWAASNHAPQAIAYGEGVAYLIGTFMPACFIFALGILFTILAYNRKVNTEKELQRQETLRQNRA